MPALKYTFEVARHKETSNITQVLLQPIMRQQSADELYNINITVHTDVSCMIRGQEKLATIFNLFAEESISL